MNNRITRRFILGGLGAVALPGAAWANAPAVSPRPHLRGEDLRARAMADGVEALISRAGLPGEVACAVADVQTGLRLEAAQGRLALPPASVAKVLTALYALARLGPDHRFATRLIADGPVSDGVLSGDLILAGGADPTLDTNGLADLAARLKAAGIRELRGRFLVCDGALPYVRTIDAGQPDHVGYSPAVSGIALNFNRVHFEWRQNGRGYAVAMDARSDRYRPEVQMARMQVKDRRLPVYTYADAGGADQWTVASQALGKGGARWLPVRKPALYAGDVFATLARSGGTVLPRAEAVRTVPEGGRILAELHSAPLNDLLRDMLKYSNNLTAEMVGMAATAANGAAPVSLPASARAMSDWAASTYGMIGTRLVDHSGLGDASRMTPVDLVGALVAARQTGVLRPLLKPIPMRDARGRIVKGHPILVDAKTGTLNFVSGLGGFMTAPDGTELAFAIFAADIAHRARLGRADREVPEGARAWNRKAKILQQKLIERWGALYGG
ncbi:MAG: D-alanyl-D-alanine carboxypeptidase/D-alanyl-D-alanine-endopeptidase [Jhaorihella sp.]